MDFKNERLENNTHNSDLEDSLATLVSKCLGPFKIGAVKIKSQVRKNTVTSEINTKGCQ